MTYKSAQEHPLSRLRYVRKLHIQSLLVDLRRVAAMMIELAKINFNIIRLSFRDSPSPLGIQDRRRNRKSIAFSSAAALILAVIFIIARRRAHKYFDRVTRSIPKILMERVTPAML